MTYEPSLLANYYKGKFLISPSELQQRFSKIKAYIFDWDGVFNNGIKSEQTGSPFSEVDAMGTNMLRFAHFLTFQTIPFSFIISGERNPTAVQLAKRENFHALYSGFKNKMDALNHLCKKNQITPKEVAFIFDDVLDLSVAAVCGIRIMIHREANPWLNAYVKQHHLADYLTAHEGGNYAVREATELLANLSGKLNQAFTARIKYAESYKAYISERNQIKTALFLYRPPENKETQ